MSRVFFFGFKYPLRRKTSIAFLILFLLLSAFFIYEYSLLDSINTDKLVETKCVILTPEREISTADANNILRMIWDSVRDYADAMYLIVYTDINPTLGVGILSAYKMYGFTDAAWKWVISEVKPTRLKAGRFPDYFGEAIVNDGAKTVLRQGETTSEIIWSIGMQINITRGRNHMVIKIVGSYITPTPTSFSELAGNAEVLLYVAPETFDYYVRYCHPQATLGVSVETANYVYIRRIIIIAKGGLLEYLQGTVAGNLKKIEDVLNRIKSEISPFSISSSATVESSRYMQSAVLTGVIFLFTIIASVIYSFLIVKFRQHEIATLRAIGWRAKDVKSYLLAELFFVTMVAFILSIIAIYAISAFYRAIPPISLLGILYSLVMVFVIPLIFGLVIIPRRVLGVSPAEAFRRA